VILDVQSILATCERLDVRLSVKGDKLAVDAPKGVLTPELRTMLTAAKLEILRLLAGAGTDADDLPIVDPPGTWAKRAAGLLAGIDDPDRRADLREAFEHRAGVCESNGELSRDDAERVAYREIESKLRERT